jgi:hypothetical protein
MDGFAVEGGGRLAYIDKENWAADDDDDYTTLCLHILSSHDTLGTS